MSDIQNRIGKYVQRAGGKYQRRGGVRGLFNPYGINKEKAGIRKEIGSYIRDKGAQFRRYQLKDWDYQQNLQTQRYESDIDRRYIDPLKKQLARAKAKGDARYVQSLEQKLKYQQRWADRTKNERRTALKRQRYDMVKNNQIALRQEREALQENAFKQIEQMREQTRSQQATRQAQQTPPNTQRPQGTRRADLGRPRQR